MQLLLATALAHHVLQLAPHAVKGIAQGHVHIFVLHMVHHQLLSWQGQVNAHFKRTPLLLVFLRLVNMDAAGHEVARHQLQLLRMRSGALLQRR